jgi:hypothetical protein
MWNDRSPTQKLLFLFVAIFMPLKLGSIAWQEWHRAEYFTAILSLLGVVAIPLFYWLDERPGSRLQREIVRNLTAAERSQYNGMTVKPALWGMGIVVVLLLISTVVEEIFGPPWFRILFLGGMAGILLLAARTGRPVKAFLRSTEYVRAHGSESSQAASRV